MTINEYQKECPRTEPEAAKFNDISKFFFLEMLVPYYTSDLGIFDDEKEEGEGD